MYLTYVMMQVASDADQIYLPPSQDQAVYRGGALAKEEGLWAKKWKSFVVEQEGGGKNSWCFGSKL
jgi:hypothetical protein